MAKASFAPQDASSTSFGIQEGNVEVVAAVSKNHQYPPNSSTGEQGDPFPCVQLAFQQYDSKWNKLDDEPVKMEFGVGKLDKFHPGLAASTDDDDPQDLGDEVDVEGNCIAVVSEGAKLNKKSKWIIFTDSMVAKGFKPEVLGNGYLPDLIGTRGHVTSIKQERMPNSTAKNDPTALVFDRIDAFPYEAKGKPATKPATAAKPPVKGAAKPPVAPATAAKPPATAATATTMSGDDEEVAKEAVQAIMTEISGDEPIALDVKALKSKVTAKLMRNKVPLNRHKGILALIGDPAWIEELSGSFGFGWDADTTSVVFPAV